MMKNEQHKDTATVVCTVSVSVVCNDTIQYNTIQYIYLMAVIRHDLGALATVQAREFWICWRRDN